MPIPHDYDPHGPSGTRHGFGPGKLKVEELLGPAELVEYEKFARQRGVTNEQRLEWLRQRGHRIGLGAVKRHSKVLNGLVHDLRQSARFAESLTRLAAEYGSDALPNLNLTRFEQIVMQKLCKDDEWHEAAGFDELGKVARVIETAIDARRELDAMRRDFERRKEVAAEEAAKASRRGGSGAEIAVRMCEILGISAPEPTSAHAPWPALPEPADTVAADEPPPPRAEDEQ
jgi:hypothetical protein